MLLTDEYLKRGISVIVEWAMKSEHMEALSVLPKKIMLLFHYQLHAPKRLLIKRVKERTSMFLNKSKLPKRNIDNMKKSLRKITVFIMSTNIPGQFSLIQKN